MAFFVSRKPALNTHADPVPAANGWSQTRRCRGRQNSGVSPQAAAAFGNGLSVNLGTPARRGNNTTRPILESAKEARSNSKSRVAKIAETSVAVKRLYLVSPISNRTIVFLNRTGKPNLLTGY